MPTESARETYRNRPPKAVITKMAGGGDSWYYVVVGDKVLSAAHEDDKLSMTLLVEDRDAYNAIASVNVPEDYEIAPYPTGGGAGALN